MKITGRVWLASAVFVTILLVATPSDWLDTQVWIAAYLLVAFAFGVAWAIWATRRGGYAPGEAALRALAAAVAITILVLTFEVLATFVRGSELHTVALLSSLAGGIVASCLMSVLVLILASLSARTARGDR